MKFFFGMHPEATRVWRSSLFTVRMLSLVMASIAFAGVLWLTEPPGPGLQPISASYLGAAASLAAGEGYRVPTAPWYAVDSTASLSRHSPGFPTAIAVPVALGFPPAQGARLVEALAAFVTVAVVLALAGDAVGMGAAALLGIALLVMPVMVDLHMAVLAEPLLLALLALTLATMVAARDHPLASGVCAAGALGVSYLGAGAVLAVVVWAAMDRVPLVQRVRRAAWALAPSLLVGAGWAVASPASAGAAFRHLHLYGGLPGALADGGFTIAGWLVPTFQAAAWVWWPAIPAAAIVVGLFVLGGGRAHRLWQLLPQELPMQSSTNVPQLVAARVLGAGAVLAASYAVVLLGARLFAYGGFTFDARLMSPLLLIAALTFAVAAATWWRSASRAWRAALLALLVVWGAASFAASRAQVRDSLTFGMDLARDSWNRSPLLDWARADGSQRPLYTNWPSLAYFYLDRPARGVPETDDPATLRAFGDSVRAHGGVVLAFNAGGGTYAESDSLVAASELRVLAVYADGRVLGPGPSTPP